MEYQTLYYQIKDLMKQGGGVDPVLGIRLEKHDFTSAGAMILPGKSKYYCASHKTIFTENTEAQPPKGKDTVSDKDGVDAVGPPSSQPAATENGSEFKLHPLKMEDSDIAENRHFSYYIMHPVRSGRSKGVILLFHGLNEKSWEKYLPWAVSMVRLTGKSVILLPIAFHMDRAPKNWSDTRAMQKIAEARKVKYPAYSHISAVNTAISIRLGNHPDRLFWSGLQTYQDVYMLIKKIKKGSVSGIAGDCTIDFFAYSIGAFYRLFY
ncbi:hypothetical protein SAMN05192529_110100 [Arachidicoccus rhizosphaerae]|uniref:Uncharacterized protein n=1 Tax=Arachidicoccus rhizosphaerae TaxID=551991 RepID=A0A1H3ZA72_9BACT|nr:DUF6051 family protein [Arachidicoccus rhizosphaerae]SEA20232.1 hypothetical protein SAMN05192529_110100 [Arachidicoccus rhizosphaerae]